MAMGEHASTALAIMWMMAGLVFILVILRVYTRVVCMAAYGTDDWIYVAAFIVLLIYTVLIQHADFFGFARLFECLGQTTSFVGMPLAKASLGAFLLRLVTVTWHRVAVWGAMTLMSLASVETTVPLIVWSAAEMAITLICIGIPVLRPLYKRIYLRFRTQSAHSSGYLKQSDRSREQPGYALHTIGGGPLDIGQCNLKRVNCTKAISVMNKNDDDFLHMQVRIGVSEPSKTTVVAQQRRLDEDSDMDTVDDYGRSQLESSTDSTRRVLGDEEQGMVNSNPRSLNTITVTQSFSVDRS
ncbi:hypothetical protein B0H65DRAFT_510725 [Neurospora tetraspora]|uniref:Integral membrane protein n=1 Tax=Neurospora tetraspora TaxID=94610 RepID=A0AAE0MQX1_9PEZI|nr:hypothetical protein B0H65DRAFT_510725 [Neurospora tetraspora]